MPPLSILLKPVSGTCNLRCSYCFYADEVKNRAVPDRGMMPRSVSHALIEGAASAGEGTVSFLFQGGEPTLAGLDFFRDFVSCVNEAFPPKLKAQYAVQTNGTLLDGDWCRFFGENRFLVGLSLDGNRICHDRFRWDSRGGGTWDRVLQAARLLEQTGVEVNVLTVVTGHLARHGQSVFASLCKNGFRFQQYIPCLSPLEGDWDAPGCSLSPRGYGKFLKTLFDLWYRELEQGRYWSIRYFDNLIRMLDGCPPEQCSMVGCCSPPVHGGGGRQRISLRLLRPGPVLPGEYPPKHLGGAGQGQGRSGLYPDLPPGAGGVPELPVVSPVPQRVQEGPADGGGPARPQPLVRGLCRLPSLCPSPPPPGREPFAPPLIEGSAVITG